MEIDLVELKFLLKLLGKQDYKAPVSEVKPNLKTKAAERDKICRQLGDRSLVSYTEEITKIKITPPGKELLKFDAADLQITSDEVKVLKTCAQGITKSTDIKLKPAQTRDTAIQKLIERGMIKVAEAKLKEVWLTDRGKEYLGKEYNPGGGGNITLSKNMFADYLQFIRKYQQVQVINTTTKPLTEKPTDEEILKAIAALNKELLTNNYLPIFHLRNKFQPPLTREELDQALYRLESEDKIELSSLQETRNYTKEQIQAGIPQDIGGTLFFIMVTE